MKKLVILILSFVCAIAAQAQLSTVGGRLTLWGDKNSLSFALVPEVEFELSEHWELGLGLGVSTETDLDLNYTSAMGIVAPSVAYIIWGNDLVEFAVAAEAELLFDARLRGAAIGLVPEIRFTPYEHLELSISLGMLGTEYNGIGWSGGIVLNSATNGIGIAYKF
ncbi:MAG: hypothetical protein J6Y77_00285 [Paludibacteraceae bacterium]|nr:hypothetical protein [Paludibacteraceae bacterium]